MADVVLSVKGIKKHFENKVILNIKSFEFLENKIYRIQGDNGCGKTTLLNILVDLLDVEEGCVERQKNNISWVSSTELGLYPRLTGCENIQIFSKLMGREVSSEILKRWLENEIFFKAYHSQFYKCSSGMKQLLKIFCSFIQSPDILVMDEPFRALSSEMRLFVAKSLKEEVKVKTIIFTDHLLEDYLFEDIQTLILKDGELKCF
jgi:ABC-type multidrug transport system ATPase subunit